VVDSRGRAGGVRAEDGPGRARHHRDRHVLGRRQAAEAVVEMRELERRHGHRAGSDAAPRAGLEIRLRSRCHNWAQPGTSPYGMNMMTTTKIKPSSVFQRST